MWINNSAPEPEGLGPSWFRFFIVPDMPINREQRENMIAKVKAYRAREKPQRLKSGAHSTRVRTWRDKLKDLFNPLDVMVDLRDDYATSRAAIRQAKFYPWLRFFRRTPTALDKLAQANAKAGTGWSAPDPSRTVAAYRAESRTWKAIAVEARKQNLARLALITPRSKSASTEDHKRRLARLTTETGAAV